MVPTVTHRLIAMFCLVAIALGNGALGPLGVKCQDASGQTSYELACAKTTEGVCLSSFGSSDEGSPVGALEPGSDGGDPYTPCEDTPISDSADAVMSLTRTSAADAIEVVAITALFAWEVLAVDLPPVELAAPESTMARPPDTIARLRTIILVV